MQATQQLAAEDEEMRAIRVYADTSVFGGVFDDEFNEESKAFFEQVRSGQSVLVASAVVKTGGVIRYEDEEI